MKAATKAPAESCQATVTRQKVTKAVKIARSRQPVIRRRQGAGKEGSGQAAGWSSRQKATARRGRKWSKTHGCLCGGNADEGYPC